MAYHDDAAEEVRGDSSYTIHASATAMTMQRSTPTRRTTQAGMADVPAMLYRLEDRRGS
jgi:hypothetical protein